MTAPEHFDTRSQKTGIELAGRSAHAVVDTVIDHVIRALHSDSGLPTRTTLEREGFLADAIDRATFDLRRLDRLIEPRQAIWAVEDFFTEYPPIIAEDAEGAHGQAH